MSRRRSNPPPSEDSFLDVVANLVGILIILVVVVAAQTREAVVEAILPTLVDHASADLPSADAAEPISAEDVAQAAAATASLEGRIHEIEAQRQNLAASSARKKAVRDQLQTLLTAAQTALARRAEATSAENAARVERQRQLAEAEAELERLRSVKEQLAAETEPLTLEHLPTPLAQTVFGHEEHFQLQAGRLSYVPMQAFLSELKADVSAKVHRLKDAPSFTDTIGPREGFTMRYTIARQKEFQKTSVGTAVREKIEVDHFVIIPGAADLGEPLAAATRDGSQLLRRLRGFSPDATTITVWVYPDSYGQYRELKQFLFDRGYLSAARPLPRGAPISGSPHGRRSSAQ